MGLLAVSSIILKHTDEFSLTFLGEMGLQTIGNQLNFENSSDIKTQLSCST